MDAVKGRTLVASLCAMAWASGCSAWRGAPRERDAFQIVEIPLGDEPDDLAVGPDHVWVAVPGSHRVFPPADGWVLKVHPATGQIVDRIRVGKRPGQVVWAAGAVWVLSGHLAHGEAQPTVMRIDPVHDRVTHVVQLELARLLAGNDSGLWIVGGASDLWRLSPASPERPTLLRRGGPRPYLDVSRMAVGEGAVWLLESRWAPELVARVHEADPETGRIVATFARDSLATDLGAGLGSLWVVNHRGKGGELGRTVSRIDPHTGGLLATIPVEPSPWFLAVCDDGVWVSSGSTVSRIDPMTNRVAEVVEVPFNCRKLACGHGAVWATRETGNPGEGTLVRIVRAASRSVPPG